MIAYGTLQSSTIGRERPEAPFALTFMNFPRFMTPLYEVSSVRQIAGEHRRRWFTSTSLDLFVWSNDGGALVGFQLVYDKEKNERALTWKLETGFVHDEVDNGESHAGSRYKAAPILRTDGEPNIDRILGMLDTCGVHVPAEIISFVTPKILEYPVKKRQA